MKTRYEQITIRKDGGIWRYYVKPESESAAASGPFMYSKLEALTNLDKFAGDWGFEII